VNCYKTNHKPHETGADLSFISTQFTATGDRFVTPIDTRDTPHFIEDSRRTYLKLSSMAASTVMTPPEEIR
jgi:hypothetical protein